MLKIVKTYKKILVDFIYSFVAYALPTIVLQFVVQPLIARHISADDNGLYIALFNVLKLMISIFIMPLANLRLLKKIECEKEKSLNAYFNFLFILIISVTVIIGSFLNVFYRKFLLGLGDIIRFLTILIFMGVHDYFIIEFRLILNYKRIVIDNCLIVMGYGLGMLLFIKTGTWEIIFICGYLFGTLYVLLSTNLWRSAPNTKNGKYLLYQYGELSASDLLKNTSIYCDRLIIYPILGGFDVSVYNAATVVSKAISVISSPLRNVLLSHIVDHDRLFVSRKKIKKIFPILFLVFVGVTVGGWGFSIIACYFLYPQYAVEARAYIPIIIVAIMIETCGAILNIMLLRFAKIRVQTIIAAIKLGIYFLAITVFNFIVEMELWGFCAAILLADIAYIFAVLIELKKNITIIE